MKDVYGEKPPPEKESKKTPITQEIEAREAAGWKLKYGYPVVFNENFQVGPFTYYCSLETTPVGSVWRIPTKDLP